MSLDESREDRNPLRTIGIFCVVGLAVVIPAMMWLPGWLTSFHSDYWDVAQRGAYGDTYGPVNALFTGLAFVVLIGTIVAQMIELGLQRRELRDTRKELRGQREQLEAQSETLQLQRFESTFFELHRVHGDIQQKIKFPDYLSQFYHPSLARVLQEVTGESVNYRHDRVTLLLERALKESGASKGVFTGHLLDRALSGRHDAVRQCLTQLFHVLQYVDDADIKNKRLYIDSIEAQLVPQSLVLILYTGLTTHGASYKPLIEKYGLLRNLPRPSAFDEWCKSLYAPSAFEADRDAGR